MVIEHLIWKILLIINKLNKKINKINKKVKFNKKNHKLKHGPILKI